MTIIISLGGSLIVPDEIDVSFLKALRKLILSLDGQVVLVTGGGKTARNYIEAAKQFKELEHEDFDWIGIHSTRLNAQLVKIIFKDIAYEKVIKNPTLPLKTDAKVIVAAGWKPGCSTDYDAALLAKNLGVKTIINLTNTSYVYDKDPAQHKDAKKLEKISWKEMMSLVGDTWDPGLNMPFDPIASKEASSLGLKVIVTDSDLSNLKNILDGKEFDGTVIE